MNIDLDQNIIRGVIFIGVLVLCALLEACFPRRSRTQRRGIRWLTNIALIMTGSLVLKLMVFATAMSVAFYAEGAAWGILNNMALPLWVECVIAFVVLDFSIYIQHVAAHKIPILWRLHRVHHADRDIDVTTGNRFHPIEIGLSMLFKSAVVLALGPAVLALFIFEIVLNASAMFNHANWRLSLRVDAVLRKMIVTPDMHRVHHSIIPKETDSNYGFFLSIWDRIFGTYIAQPKAGHDGMTIGLASYQTKNPSNLWWCLLLPFRQLKKTQNSSGSYPGPS